MMKQLLGSYHRENMVDEESDWMQTLVGDILVWAKGKMVL